MSIKAQIRAAIRDVEAFSRSGRVGADRLKVDLALGHLYEAYAQFVLDERGLKVDIAKICGFVRFVGPVQLNRLLPLLQPVRDALSLRLAA